MADLSQVAIAAILEIIEARYGARATEQWRDALPSRIDPRLNGERWLGFASEIIAIFNLRSDQSISPSAEQLARYEKRPLGALLNLIIDEALGRKEAVPTQEAEDRLKRGHKFQPDRSNSLAPGSDGDPPGIFYRLWFGTNRAPHDSSNVTKGFSGERGEKAVLGRCTVLVPKGHRVGSIGSSFFKRLWTGADDRLKIESLCLEDEVQFWFGLRTHLGSLDSYRKHAVVFIHGYNVSFDEAALRAAQIGFDLGVEAMAFFSWPSKGTLTGYMADGAAIEASEDAITDFLVQFATKSGAEHIHVIAHSMGNRGLLRAVNRIVGGAQLENQTFGQFILAAADVDGGFFRAHAASYVALGRKTTLYVSSRDKALAASGHIADFVRAGHAPPVCIVPGCDTVSVSAIDLSFLGHGYVAEQRNVLSDIHQLIFFDLPPDRRSLIERDVTAGGWRLRA